MPRWIQDPATGELLEPATYYARKASRARSHLPSPMVLMDGCEVTSPLDGKTYTSKSKLRETYRAAGVVEVGNEKFPTPKQDAPIPGVKQELARAWEAST